MNFTYDAGRKGQLMPLVSSAFDSTSICSTLLARSSWIVPQSIMMPRSAHTRVPTDCPTRKPNGEPNAIMARIEPRRSALK